MSRRTDAPARRASAAALSLLAVLVLPVAAAGQGATFQWDEAMAAGTVLTVRGITGSIRAVPADGRTASVTAEKRGRASDMDEVDIRVEEDGDGWTVCAIYHPHAVVGSGCDVDRDGRRDRSDRDHGADVSVDYVVRLPAGVELDANMVTGDVTVEGVRSDVEASTVSGDVVVTTTGRARAQSVSGSLDVSMGSLDWDRLSFQTVSGDIDLRLPDGLATTLDFESVSGDLDSDFGVEVTRRRGGRWVGSSLRGVIGGGGERELSVRTVSGDVRLRRGG